MKSPADMKVIQIELTNACPMRCSNCTRFCGHHVEPFFMDFETFKKAIDSLKGFKGIVGIMGGEPTIHPEFKKFIEYFRDNWGHEDNSTALYEPSSDFMRHILANGYHVDYSNQRGLWTSITPRYYEHFELIQDTFGYQLLNDHTSESAHQTHMVTRKELGIPDDEWIEMRDRCWVQNLWSASITPKGAFFCEIAAAMDATLGGPGGWAIEPGWWNRKPEDFGSQLDWCEMCSACLPMPSRNANDETDDISPIWQQRLEAIDSPKLRKGLVNTLDPTEYQKDKHAFIETVTPYLDDEEARMGKSRQRLVPHRITHVAWLSESIDDDGARALLASLKADQRLDAVVSTKPEHAALAGEAGAPFFSGPTVLADVAKATKTRDWIMLVRDHAASSAFHELTKIAVFNPGVVYTRDRDNEWFQFFNLRASSLANGGNLFDITRSYPAYKIVPVASDDPEQYRLSDVDMFLRRAYKRVNWLKRKMTGQPVARGPAGEIVGNRIVASNP
ncbi:MAG TPA: radical SAM protein [Thermoanaerobaculia bacterium]|nr:radical SAM protein [Thermoanaerobaculia bacterium]